MSNRSQTPEDRFSHDVAQLLTFLPHKDRAAFCVLQGLRMSLRHKCMFKLAILLGNRPCFIFVTDNGSHQWNRYGG